MIKLPEDFNKQIQETLGNESAAFFNSLETESPVSIRLNPKKNYRPENLDVVPWSQYGFYLPERPVFTLDPLFHAGAYYVQEASSMFLEQVLKQTVNLKQSLNVLDLCGAPGGKATHLVSLLSDDSLLVTNEVIRSRAKILAENMTKWGYPNVVVTNNDPSDFKRLVGFFDVLLVDAPCSGEGLFRKDPNAINEWSTDNVNHCAARQQRILNDAWDTLKPGGKLIYSTCTYNRKENEEKLAWLINDKLAEPVTLDIEAFPEITLATDLPGYHFYPHKTKGEGFFIAVLQKKNGEDFKFLKIRKPTLVKTNRTNREEVSKRIEHAHSFEFFDFQDRILIFPRHKSNALYQLRETLNLVQAGISITEVKGKNLIPTHALAMSIILSPALAIPETLDLENALKYLKKEDVHPQNNQQYLLATFRQTPLGWLKKAGNRYNNLYPKEWRIRMRIDE